MTEATTRHVPYIGAPISAGYGYQWWLYDHENHDAWLGQGFGGQYLIVIPSIRAVAVVNSWNALEEGDTRIAGDLMDALLRAAGAIQ